MSCENPGCECLNKTGKKLKLSEAIDNASGKTIKICSKTLVDKTKIFGKCCICKKHMFRKCLHIQKNKRTLYLCVNCADQEKGGMSFKEYFERTIENDNCLLYKMFPKFLFHLNKKTTVPSEFCPKCEKKHPKNVLKELKPFVIFSKARDFKISETQLIMRYISKMIEETKDNTVLTSFIMGFLTAKKKCIKGKNTITSKKRTERIKKTTITPKKKSISKEECDTMIHYFIPIAKKSQIEKIRPKRVKCTPSEIEKTMKEKDVIAFANFLKTGNVKLNPPAKTGRKKVN